MIFGSWGTNEIKYWAELLVIPFSSAAAIDWHLNRDVRRCVPHPEGEVCVRYWQKEKFQLFWTKIRRKNNFFRDFFEVFPATFSRETSIWLVVGVTDGDDDSSRLSVRFSFVHSSISFSSIFLAFSPAIPFFFWAFSSLKGWQDNAYGAMYPLYKLPIES